MENTEEITTKKAKFRAWFNKKWAEWDILQGHRTTQQELSDYLEIPRSTIAQYVSGKKPPDNLNLLKVARRFGFEVYDILGEKPPDDAVSRLPVEVEVLIERISLEIEKRGLEINSPEALEISTIIFDEWISKRKSSL